MLAQTVPPFSGYREKYNRIEGLALDVTEYDSGAVRRGLGGIMAGHERACHA
jgi:hypothetical protein